MRSVLTGGAGALLILLVAASCGSADKSRAAYESGGEGGQGEAGESQAPGGSPGGRQGGAAGAAAAANEPAAAGADGSAVTGGGAAGTRSAGDAGGSSGGDFVPPASRLALGGPRSCVQKLDDTVACWGRGDHGELGDGEFYATSPNGLAEAVAVTGLAGVVALASGLYHSCALDRDALLTCWGAGYAGQLGDDVFHTGDDAGAATPRAVDLPGVVQIAAAGDNTCALLEDGTVRCWGDNLFGQLGNGTMDDSAVPVAVEGLSGVTQVVVGKFMACALMDDSTVQCWGYGGVNNQTGSAINLVSPTPIAGLTDVTALAAGDSFACALVAGGAVRCWGEGDVGQLGDGLENDSNSTPVEVTGLGGIVQLSAGGRHVCALDSDRAVWCWGDGQYGQLGDGVYHNGFPNYVKEPVAATVLTDVVEVECGATHTCVRTSNDEVECIGQGTYGQLGDGSFYSALPFGSATLVKALSL